MTREDPQTTSLTPQTNSLPSPPQMKIITRTIWILSLVSMLADMASEMLYPVIPVYLKEIGFSVVLIGLMEGLAELVIGLSKGYFGKLSDSTGRRLPFVKAGYLLSALSKSLMGLFTQVFWVFLARSSDRLGKGLRTAARDALLSSASTPATRGRVFGFHRSWDTIGAVIGPLLAMLFLYFYPGQYRWLFLWAIIPGLLSVSFLFLLKETGAPTRNPSKNGFFSYFGYWKTAPPAFRKLVLLLLLFALANSSDLFLLLKAKEITGEDNLTILGYLIYNLVYALASFPMGMLADRFGMKPVFLTGLLLFVLVYLGFAFSPGIGITYALFGLYGCFAAATEGIGKAWITQLVPATETATAIGFFTSFQSLLAFASSLIAGGLWAAGGSHWTFGFSALLAGIAVLFLSRLKFHRI